MFRQVRFDCGACGEGFVDWHDQEWERTPVFCVNCGERIVAGAAVAVAEGAANQAQQQPVRSVGVIKSEGDGFPDTLPAMRAAQPVSTGHEAPESARPAAQKPSNAPPAFANASSSAPAARSGESRASARLRKLAPLGAALLGFAIGVPLTLLAEAPVSHLLQPQAQAAAQLSKQFAAVAKAIDEGAWERARSLLVRCSAKAPASDRRLATLRARLALGLILANRRDEAAREMSGVAQLPHVHPSQEELRRVSEALYPATPSTAATAAKPSTAAAAATAAVAATSGSAKPASKRAVLTFARDLQRRSQLDDAQHLYEAVLRYHPDDSEARCGLAEVQMLRGSVADAEALFQAALQRNPGYAPAWVGLGDIDWLRGRPELAACRYRVVVGRFPSGSYPPYIAQRIERVLSSGASVPSPDDAASTPYSCGN